MYLPSLGFCFLFGFIAQRNLEIFDPKHYWGKWVYRSTLTVLFFCLGMATFKQSAFWKNSLTIWQSAIEQYPNHAAAYNYRGEFYRRSGKPELAIRDFNRALAINPGYIETYNNRGVFFIEQKKMIWPLPISQKRSKSTPKIISI